MRIRIRCLQNYLYFLLSFLAILSISACTNDTSHQTVSETEAVEDVDSLFFKPEYIYLAQKISLINGLFDSIDLAVSMKDYNMEATINAKLANQFRLAGNYNKSLQFYREAMTLSQKAASDTTLADISHGLAALCFEVYYHDSVNVNYLDSASKYADTAYVLAGAAQVPMLVVSSLNVRAAVEIQRGNYESAKSMLEEAFAIAKVEGNDPGLAPKSNLAYLYYMSGDYSEGLKFSEEAYYQALKEGNIVFTGIALRMMGLIYRGMGELNKALEAERLLSEVSDAKYMMLQSVVMEQQLLNYQLKKEQEAVSGLNRERFHLIRRSRILALSIMLLVLVSLALLFLLRQHNKIREKEKELVRERQKAHELELQNTALELAAKEARAKVLEVDLESKNLSLANKLLNLSKVNEFLSSLKQDICQLAEHPDSKTLPKSLMQIEKQISNQLNKNVWDDFELLYGAGNSSFVNRLLTEHPGLTTNEKRLCYLILYDLTTKEISDILQKNYRSVEMARHRLRNRLGLGNEDNLRSYLLKFTN